jgi:hypothetical protein
MLASHWPGLPGKRHGLTCWHKRAALLAAKLYRDEQRAMRELEAREGLAEMAAEDAAAFTVEVDYTSSSLDGVKFETCPASGNKVPMR